jgi:hypothetical protein
MQGHIHYTFDTNANGTCRCGEKICSSINSETGNGCTLSEGHSGPHMNEWTKDGESWEGR